ncbi:MAG: hypothetical protein ACYDD5_00845 [Sulfuricurvum sp.]
MPIAYLIESTEVSSISGKIRGTSLRAYEVDYSSSPNRPWRLSTKPTGKLFTIKNGKIVITKTKATLENKYVRISEAFNSIDTNFIYGCTLYTTPELALAAKYQAIHNNVSSARKQAQLVLDTIDKDLAAIPDASFLRAEYPEYFI